MLVNNTIKIRKVSLMALSLSLYLLSLSLATINLPIGGSALRYIALIPIAVSALYILRVGKVRINYIHVLFILYTLMQLFSLFYSINVKDTLSRVITYVMFSVLLVATTCVLYKREDISFINGSYLWASRLTAVFTLIFARNIEGGRLSLDNGVFTEDPNYLCGYFVYGVILCISILLSKKKNITKKILPSIELLVYAYILFSTGSRGGVLGVLLGVAVYVFFFYVRQKDKLRVTFILIIFIMGSIILAQYALSLLPESVQARYSISGIIQSQGTGRYALWKTAFSIYLHSDLFHLILGYGPGTIKEISIGGLYMTKVTHNLWLETLIEQGILGLVLLSSIMIECFKSTWRKKDLVISAAFIGMMGLTLSLSLYAYKPLWNLIILICLLAYDDKNQRIIGEGNSEYKHN